MKKCYTVYSELLILHLLHIFNSMIYRQAVINKHLYTGYCARFEYIKRHL